MRVPPLYPTPIPLNHDPILRLVYSSPPSSNVGLLSVDNEVTGIQMEYLTPWVNFPRDCVAQLVGARGCLFRASASATRRAQVNSIRRTLVSEPGMRRAETLYNVSDPATTSDSTGRYTQSRKTFGECWWHSVTGDEFAS